MIVVSAQCVVFSQAYRLREDHALKDARDQAARLTPGQAGQVLGRRPMSWVVQ